MISISKIFLILTSLFLFSCQNTKTQDINKIIKELDSQKSFNKVENFGKNQIIKRSWTLENGDFVDDYNFTSKQTKFYEFLPIISYFLPQTYSNREVVIVYDKKNNIKDTEDFYNIITLKSRLFCNPSAFSCVEKF